MIAGTSCCKLIIFVYIYALANIQEDCLYQVEFDFQVFGQLSSG